MEYNMDSRGGTHVVFTWGVSRHHLFTCSFRFKKVPTFSEFVDFLLSTEVETYNEHWLPYYLLCTPCHLNYTVIAKTEDISDDSRSLMEVIICTSFGLYSVQAHSAQFSTFELVDTR